tara:strand:+ start:12792 stop:13388 length:597 start_codon:yes stop_codon:yes gene_type:complete
MGVIRTKTGNFLGTASDSLDKITSLANGLMCLPATLKGFLSPGFYKSTFSSITNLVVDTVRQVIEDTITSQLDFITNRINWFIDNAFEVVVDGINSVRSVIAFIKSFKQRIQDSIKFIKNTENCSFSAASMMSCVAEEAARRVKKKVISDIQKNTSKYVNEIANQVSETNGAIGRHLNRQLSGLDKARKQIEFQNLIR